MFNGSEESYIILQNTLLTGIKDVSFQSSVKQSSTKLLANKNITRRINGPADITCSFSKPYNGADFCQYLTGVTNLSGQFIYGENALNFTNAAISEYSFNLDERGLGQVQVQMKIHGEMTPTTNLRLSEASQDFEILNELPKIVFFDLDGTRSAVNSLDLQSSFNVQSSNEIGSINSSNVKITFPNHKISANILMLEQEVEDITGMVETSSLTKDIRVIFASDENLSSVNEILEIESGANEFASQGIYIGDLDFSLGACAYNDFRFPEASINSQELSSSVGDIIQLKKNYSAYNNSSHQQQVFSSPSDIPSCEHSLRQARINFFEVGVRAGRNMIFDFEDSQTGETDFNLWQNPSLLPKIEDDFEFEVTGEYEKYISIELTSFLNRVDFEAQNTGETDLFTFLVNYYYEKIDFEDQNIGETNENIKQL